MFSRSFRILTSQSSSTRSLQSLISPTTKAVSSAPYTLSRASFATSSPSKMPTDQAKETKGSGEKPGEEAGELKTGEYKNRAPYRTHTPADHFEAKWEGSCHCGKVQYQLSREKPLTAKYCHCTTCQVLHGAPFQWAAIFHKEDINFTDGHHSLTWYDSPDKKLTHHLPCKVSCSYCRTPIMDEGRNMILLYPLLIKGIEKKGNAEKFRPTCHMFYPQRVIDIKDGITKFAGLDKQSDILDDEGNFVRKWEDEEKRREANEQGEKRKREETSGDGPPEGDPKEGKL